MGRYSLVQNVKERRHDKPKLQRDITLELDGSENAALNIEGLKDYEMPSAVEAYEFYLQNESFSCEEEQEDIFFDFILSYQS